MRDRVERPQIKLGGCDMARLVKNNASGEAEVFELKLGVNRFGRRKDSDFQLDHHTISGAHAEFVLTADGVSVRDCGSTNGTYVNNERVEEAVLSEGQTVRLGDVEFFVETTEVIVAIPEYERPQPAPPVVLEDGSILCKRHPKSRATHRCTHCLEILCEACVTRLRRKGGRTLKLCGLCSHGVELLGPEKKKKRTFLSLIETTLRLPFMHNKKDS